MKSAAFQKLLETVIHERAELASLRDAGTTCREAARDYARSVADRELVELIAISAARRRSDTETATRLLVELALDVGDGKTLSGAARQFLSRALLAAARQPDKAAGALGLALTRGRPKKNLTPWKKAAIARFMYEVSRSEGLPLRPSAKRDSAAECAAREFNVSPETAQNAYTEFRPNAKKFQDSRNAEE